MPEEKLKEVLDQITRKVTEDSVGIQLIQGESEPGEDVCTVHIRFRKGFRSSLSLRADTAMLTRLTQSMLQEENVTPQDLEDVTKEYFNVLCGHISSALYQATQIASRFSIPSFHQGSYSPEDHEEQFVLNYGSDQEGTVQLVHHIPGPQEQDGTQFNQIRQKEGNKIMAKRVMVVDDSRIQEIQIRKLLEGTDYEVVSYCSSGEQALEAYGEVKPDVVTMDIIMPGMDGLETAQAILEEHPEAKIVVISSLAYDATFDEAKAVGAKAFIDKPFDQEKLLTVLDQVLAEK